MLVDWHQFGLVRLGYFHLILVPFLLIACESPKGIRTPITRTSQDPLPISTSEALAPPQYPWDKWDNEILPITAAHFRCKGKSTNPLKKGEGAYYADCRGIRGHSLPLIEEEPGVYPILIELLNHLQSTLKKPVHITCGHRCPTHNTYADPSKRGQTSKHMIGAEVDFYVEGLEWEPEKVVESLVAFYEGEPPFSRYEKRDTDVATFPWYNREVFIKLYRENEGRDGDNEHPYPYISIQVRYDKSQKKPVVYTWDLANNHFLRE